MLAAAQTIGTLAGMARWLGAFATGRPQPVRGNISGSGGPSWGRPAAGANCSPVRSMQQGTLVLPAARRWPMGWPLQVGAAGTVAPASETVGALAGTSALVLDQGRFTTGGTGAPASTAPSGGGNAKAGAGSLSLGGTNSHTGGLALLGGTLAVSSDGALGAVAGAGTPASLLFDGGTLQATASVTLAPTRQLVLQGAGGTLQVDAGHTLVVPAALADGTSAGVLAKTGSGTLALTAAADSQRSGATVVQAGALALQRDGQLGTPAGALVLDGGTLQVDQSLQLADARVLRQWPAHLWPPVPRCNCGLVATSTGQRRHAAKTAMAACCSAARRQHLHRRHPAARRQPGCSVTASSAHRARWPPADRRRHPAVDETPCWPPSAAWASGATLQVADGRVVGLAGAVADAPGAGGGTLAKTGAGLQGAAPRTHTGATQVLDGTLALSADSQLGAVPGVATPGHLLLDGGTLQADAGFTLAAARGLQLGAGGGTVAVPGGQQLAFAGVLSGLSADPAQGALTNRMARLLSGATPWCYPCGAGSSPFSDAQLGTAPASATRPPAAGRWSPAQVAHPPWPQPRTPAPAVPCWTRPAPPWLATAPTGGRRRYLPAPAAAGRRVDTRTTGCWRACCPPGRAAPAANRRSNGQPGQPGAGWRSDLANRACAQPGRGGRWQRPVDPVPSRCGWTPAPATTARSTAVPSPARGASC
jgi:autotransporter-associated beta strand protein